MRSPPPSAAEAGSGAAGGASATAAVDARAMAVLRADGRFDALIERHGPAGPFARRDVFDGCVRAVVFQQLHGGAAREILARLRAAVGAEGGAPLRPCDLVHRSVDDLRAAGLSRPKAGYVLGCAQRWHAGEFTQEGMERMDDASVKAALMSVKGYGEWSAEVVMLGSLRRTDVLPLGDYALIKGAGRLLGRAATKAQVAAAFANCQPFRSYVAFYLWKLADPAIDVE
jgi:DNA-3-methyladenine glycosylase II